MTSIAELRAVGSRVVRLVTSDGTFEGRILQERLGDDALMLMLAPVATPDAAIVVALATIETIASLEER